MKFRKQQHHSKQEFNEERRLRRAKSDAKKHRAEHMYSPKNTEGAPMPQRSTRTNNGHGSPPRRHEVEGTIRITSKGVGYVEVDGMDEDIEIDPAFLGTALDGDRVRIVLFGKKAGAREGGEVVAVLFREKTKWVGTIIRKGGTFFLDADDPRMYRRLLIPIQELHGAAQGEKVLVALTSWKDAEDEPLGKVVRVIGMPGIHDVEMSALALERGFDTTFDPDVIKAAEAIPFEIPSSEYAGRRDMRETTTFTIDPADAKDFDDALSWKKLQGGGIEIGVHIADVSHYVTAGSRLDKEACERATSVYLVDRTLPMLPERLSNGICSLVPNEDRLAFSVIFTFGANGRILDEWFGKTVIHSVRRFNYEEAEEVLDRGQGDHVEALRSLNLLAKKLRFERIKAGAIAFEAEEVKFRLDKDGRPLGVYRKKILDTNKLIEEFMLLANKRVATLIATRDKRAESVFVYRVHSAPDEERMRDLQDFLRGIGYHLPAAKDGSVSSRDVNTMLSAVEGKAESSMIQMATVRAMAKAVYATKNIGHYGLGFNHYTHFTSPIRRYPDLMVHRLLHNYLSEKPVPKKTLEEHEHLARYCSRMEVAAAEAERDSIRMKQCEYWAMRGDAVWKGTISGVTEWGVYVEEPETKTEGMLHIRDIPNDYYIFEEKNYRLVGRSTKRAFRLGDPITVRLRIVDVKKRQIGLTLLS